MRLYKTEGIILKRKNFGESDRLLTLFTPEYGKIRVLAKGVRKITSRRSGHLEIFNKASFGLYKGKTLDTVTDVLSVQAYTFLPTQLVSLSYAFYICELIDVLLPERQEHDEVYELLETILQQLSLCNSAETCDVLTSETALKLLRLLGYLPAEKQIPFGSLHSYVESITEKKLKTPLFIQKMKL